MDRVKVGAVATVVIAFGTAFALVDRGASTRETVAVEAEAGPGGAAPTSPSPPAPRPGSLAAFDEEFGGVLQERADGGARIVVDLPSGQRFETAVPPALAEELGTMTLLARASIQCDPGCGWADVVAEYRPTRDTGSATGTRLVRSDETAVGQVGDYGGALRLQAGAWLVTVPLANINDEFIEVWAAELPVVPTAPGWLHIASATEQFRLIDATSHASVELSREPNHVRFVATPCDSEAAEVTLTAFDGGGTAAFGTACVGNGSVHADIEETFVRRVLNGFTP